MSDAELIAYAALAHNEAVLMEGDNAQRAKNGLSPAWTSEQGFGIYGEMLVAELKRRRATEESRRED